MALARKGEGGKSLEILEKCKKVKGKSLAIGHAETIAIGRTNGIGAALEHLKKLDKEGIKLTSPVYHGLLVDFPKSYEEIERSMKERKVLMDIRLLNEFLGIQVASKDSKGIMEKIKMMVSLSLTPNKETFDRILKGLTASGDWKNLSTVFPLMFKFKIPVTASFVMEQIDLCMPVNVEAAMKILEQAISNGVVLSEAQFDTIVKNLKSQRHLNEVERVFQLALGAGVKLKDSTFGQLVEVYGEEGDPGKMMAVFEKMKESSGNQREAYRQILTSLGKAGKLDKMWKVWDECKDVVEPDQGMYETMMLSANHVDVGKVSQLVEHMISKGVSPNAATFVKIMQLFSALAEPKQTKEIFEKLSAAGAPLDTPTCNSVLACYTEDLGKPQEVEQLFEKMKEKKVRPNLATYEQLMTYYRNRNEPEKVLQLFKECEIQMDPQFLFSTVVDTLAKADMPEKIEELFHSGKKRSTFAYNRALTAFLHKGDDTSIRNLLKQMKHEKVDPDIYTFSQVSEALKDTPKELIEMFDSVKGKDLKAYHKAMSTFAGQGDISTSRKLFHQLRSEGLTPDLVTYKSLVQTYRVYEDSDELARESESAQLKNLKRFNEVAGSLTKTMGIDKLTSLFEDTGIESNVGPREEDYSSRGHVLLSILDDAKSVGVQPDGFLYAMVLDTLGRLDCFDLMESTFIKMKEEKIRVPPMAISALLNGYRKQHKGDRMLQLIEEAKSKHSVVPSLVDFNMVVDAFAKTLEPEKARNVIEMMKNHGLTPDEITYSTFVNALCQGRPDMTAWDIVNEITKNGIPMSTVSLNMLLLRLAKDGDVSSVDKLTSLAEKQGIQLESLTYAILLNLVGTLAGDIPKMEAILQKAVDSKVRPTAAMYFSLAQAYNKAGDTKSLGKVFESILQLQAVSPDMSTLSTVLNTLADLGKPDQMEIAFNRLKERNIRAFNTALLVFGKKNFHSHMYKLYKRMVPEGVQPNYRTANIITSFVPRELAIQIRAMGFDTKPLFSPITEEELSKLNKILSAWDPQS